MNEKEERMVAKIMGEVLDFELSKYQTLFLTQLAIRRYRVEKKKKKETLKESVTKVMERMPELCLATKGLEHKKNVVQTSYSKSLKKLEEELCDSHRISDKLLRGDVVENVLNYLINE